jgi:hypothetical protein
MHHPVIGWRRDYTNPTVPVTNIPLTSGERLVQPRDPLQKVTLFLEKVYSLPEMRGYDLYDLAYVKKGEHANFLLDQGTPVLFVYPPWTDPEDSPAKWYQRNHHAIDPLMQRYPGLFVVQTDQSMVGGRRKKEQSSRTGLRRRKWSRKNKRNRTTKRGKRKSLGSKTKRKKRTIST